MNEYKEIKLLELSNNYLFHDLFNKYNMDTMEWIVMQILQCSYQDIKGKIKFLFTEKCSGTIDLSVELGDFLYLIELNNHFNYHYMDKYLNIFENSMMLSKDNCQQKIKGIIINFIWNKYTKNPYDEKSFPIIIHGRTFPFISLVNVNMRYFQKQKYLGINDCDVLYKLLTRTNLDELLDIVIHEKKLKNYYQKLKILSSSQSYSQLIYEVHEENIYANQVNLIQKNMIMELLGYGFSLGTVAYCLHINMDLVESIQKEYVSINIHTPE